MNPPTEEISRAVQYLQSRISSNPTVGLVLGSGLNPFADRLEHPLKIPFKEIPGFAHASVEGHVGTLVAGNLGGLALLAQQGRLHFYEGHPLSVITLPIRVMALLGVKILVLTNSAGGVNRSFSPGDLMLINDHINLFGSNPLIGENLPSWGPRFPDMSEVYDQKLRQLATEVANSENLTLKQGVYLGSTGPSYETPAEVRMMALLGADAVGMSTVPEAIVARQMNLRVIGISCISNMATGISPQPLDHQEVITTGQRVRTQFESLLRGILREIAARKLV